MHELIALIILIIVLLIVYIIVNYITLIVFNKGKYKFK